ncbi:MAG TPA: serine--tRNA ligase [Candidatus Saccharimonadia bacterium]|nr:serine--tRNA ligase [Candidatus Saccharimonadia bacterium]
MLDIQYVRDNPELVKQKSIQKNIQVDVDKLLALDAEIKSIQQNLESLRNQRNLLNGQISSKPNQEEIDKATEIKNKVIDLEKKIEPLNLEYNKILKSIPNMPLDDVPQGASEADNVVVKKVGEIKKLDFVPKNHWELSFADASIDKVRAAKIAGSRFVYIKGSLVELQFAIIQWTMHQLADERVIEKLIQENNLKLVSKPFIPILPPALINTKAYEATTRLDAEETTYKLSDDELWLNASAEHSLCNMYMDEIVDEKVLPIRYLGYATSFRREAGTYGKDTEGTIRMHQFDKLEMEIFSTPETGLDEHKLAIAVDEYLVKQLDLPYQLLQKCIGEIGKPNARGVDIEVWFPGQQKYRETHTADYMTDYQARSLRTRLRRQNGSVEYLHTNDATAFAFPRLLAAIMENYQTEDGHVIVPLVLRPYMNNKDQV